MPKPTPFSPRSLKPATREASHGTLTGSGLILRRARSDSRAPLRLPLGSSDGYLRATRYGSPPWSIDATPWGSGWDTLRHGGRR
jgi:hypothetical protein